MPGFLAVLILLWQTPLERGQAAFQVKDWPAAHRWFAEALRATPADAAVHKWLGMTYAAQEKFVLAEAPFRRACELKPADPDACYYHGRTLYVLGRLELALAAFEKARKTGAKPGRVLLGLALTHEKLGHDAEADTFFQQAIAAGDKQAVEDYKRFRRKPATKAPNAGRAIRFEPQELPFTSGAGARGERHLPETMIVGVVALDYDNGGNLDLFFACGASMPGLDGRPRQFWNRLVRNRGYGEFDHCTDPPGLQPGHFAMGVAAADVTLASCVGKPSLPWSGRSTAVADFDNDGWKDLVTANRDVMDKAEVTWGRRSRQRCQISRNPGNGTFEASDITGAAFHPGLAWVDLNTDGRLDLVMTRLNEPAVILRNRTPAPGNWVAFRLRGRTSNRDGIGARIKLLRSGGGVQWSRTTTSGSYGASVPPVAHCGLAQADTGIVIAEVEWPSDRRQTIRAPQVDAVNEVVETE